MVRSPGAEDAGHLACQHKTVGGRRECGAELDMEGVHEYICNIGGGPNTRHARLRNWLADRIKETYGGDVSQERQLPGRPGDVMDIVAQTPEGVLWVDTTVVSVATVNVAERLRRANQPERALYAMVREKNIRYGNQCLPFAMEDGGRVSSGASELLRKMAVRYEGWDCARKYRELLGAHVMLMATASMLQGARGTMRTA